MIGNFFVLSPRGDTILAKQYRNESVNKAEVGAHERSHTEAFFRKIKFWDDATSVAADAEAMDGSEMTDGTHKRTGDAPPVFVMPDGLSYFHVKRNGLVFGASSARNVSPNTVLEVCSSLQCFFFRRDNRVLFFLSLASIYNCPYFQGLLWNSVRGSPSQELYLVLRVA